MAVDRSLDPVPLGTVVAVAQLLLARDTRTVALTDNGDAMVGCARTILAAQDQAISCLTGSAMRGRLQFGAADALARTPVTSTSCTSTRSRAARAAAWPGVTARSGQAWRECSRNRQAQFR